MATSEPLKCCVCDNPPSIEDPIINCGGCNINVHVCCYGIEEPFFDWKCSVCLEGLQKENIICALCLKNDGAMKRTECKQWVHVICALFMEGVEFPDVSSMEPVNIKKVSITKLNKCCIFCELSDGYCMKCSTKNCRNFFHVSCAHNRGTLSEENVADGGIDFRGYCDRHNRKKRLSVDNVKNVIGSKRKEVILKNRLSADASWILKSMGTNSNDASNSHFSENTSENHENINTKTTDNDDLTGRVFFLLKMFCFCANTVFIITFIQLVANDDIEDNENMGEREGNETTVEREGIETIYVRGISPVSERGTLL